MNPINPARISQILSALSSPSERSAKTVQPSRTSEQSENRRVLAKLRSRLENRLSDLKDEPDYAAQAPVIAIQEMLLWEFGDRILENPEFERVVHQVAATLLQDERMATALHKLINKVTTSSGA
ncbi:MAG: hypothetical protein Q7T36_08520 [Fluviicoccus sp.]|uniref:hypothetical protein n=1 Tax=Fluviicoccus sp. TaxID=2003552 RepID=UPI0027174A9A|nr:hypothetical protein [Fluviicoccus sp.]MDO8330498.1 hypothetical protein [Fluviicoccus sp.]